VKVVDVSLLTFTASSDGTSYSLTKCDTSASGRVVIPATYKDKPVTSIRVYAFYNCTGLTSIEIPNSVTSIGDYAFSYCSNLKFVYIETTNTGSIMGASVFGEIDGVTIYCVLSSKPSGWDSSWSGSATEVWGCNNASYLNFYQDGSAYILQSCNTAAKGYVKIPSVYNNKPVVGISGTAFEGCTKIEVVNISEGIEWMGDMTFIGCTKLKSVSIPKSLINIGLQVVANCNNLTSVRFESTSGWFVSTNPNATSGTNLNSTDLANTSTAVTYLKSTYASYYWIRKVN